MTTNRYEVLSTGSRTHYVVHIVSREFLGLSHKSRRAAQAACDRANQPREAKQA